MGCLFPLHGPPELDSDSDEDEKEDGGNRGFNVVTEDGGERTGKLFMFNQDSEAADKGPPLPPSVKRVGDIFDDPQFFVDGANAKDVRQGYNGDCWFLSALMALCNLSGEGSLIEKICVARDQDVGVYGFVVFRDGEWESVIVDDKLYLRKPDYEDCDESVRREWEANRIRVSSEEEYRKEYQSNSGALWFAQSTHKDETWVPLLEKAYAKAHGDYGAIEGGRIGEGVEDLTGGTSIHIHTSDILSKERFWKDLLKVNEEYLFGCSSPNWHDPEQKGRDGIHGSHAYTILRAVEYKDEKLLLIKNPWGQSEWKGPWGDGSKEWTSESIKDLGHTFGDDGVFWIRYADLLRKYNQIYRTRLFTDEWHVAQQWVSVAIPWAGEYQDTKFEIVLEKSAQTVIILSQLDDRYFRGLTGQYVFSLSFRVHKAGDEEYIMRTFGEFYTQRSVNTELFLEAGTYEVRLKISAARDEHAAKVEDVVKENWLKRREKLLRVGLSYDLAHAKAQLGDAEEKEEEKEAEKSPAKTITTVTKTSTITETTKTETEVKGEKKVEKPKEGPPGAAPAHEADAEAAPESGEPEADAEAPNDHGEAFGGESEEKKTEEEEKKSEHGGDDSDDEVADAWGAVAVVGLRVYCRDAGATIQVIRPKPPVSAEKTRLDVDDPARDASKAGEAKLEDQEKEKVDKKETAQEVEKSEGTEATGTGNDGITHVISEASEEVKKEVEEAKMDVVAVDAAKADKEEKKDVKEKGKEKESIVEEEVKAMWTALLAD